MAKLNDLMDLVRDYESKIRHPDLERYTFIDKFDLRAKDPVCPVDAARSGVYAIFSDEDLIYIGKSSAHNKAIWHRIVDHIFSTKKSVWWSEATHFVAWAVPDESRFEASALEEFLIYRLKKELPNNRLGK